MSKNIDEIVESVLPYDYDNSPKQFIDFCRLQLKQALTEGKLVVPLTIEQIKNCISNSGIGGTYYELDPGDCEQAWAESIYEAQFGGNK